MREMELMAVGSGDSLTAMAGLASATGDDDDDDDATKFDNEKGRLDVRCKALRFCSLVRFQFSKDKTRSLSKSNALNGVVFVKMKLLSFVMTSLLTLVSTYEKMLFW